MVRRSGTGAGGGIGNSKVVNVSAPKPEPRARAINPGGVGQLGNKQGSHATDRRHETPYRGEEFVRGKGYNVGGPTDNVKAVGVGGGRDVHRSGSQATYGATSGSRKPDLGPILKTFGKDYNGGRR
jgi:hypothetical protein